MAEGKQVHLRKAEDFKCYFCDQNVDTMLFKCVDCDKHMCLYCAKGHTKMKWTKDHKIIKNQFGPIRSSVTKYCMAHPGEDFTGYCGSCEKLICFNCIRQEHDGENHTKMKIGEVTDQKQKNLHQKVIEIQNKHIPKIDAKIQEMETLKTENENVTRRVTQDIMVRNEQLIAELDQIKVDYIAKVEQVMQKNDTILNQSRNELISEKERYQELYKKYDKILQTGSNIEKIVAEQEIKLDLETMNSDRQKEINMLSFELGNSDIASLQQLYGCLTVRRKSVLLQHSDKHSETSDTDQASCRISKPLDGKGSSIKIEIKRKFNLESRNILIVCPLLQETAIFHCSRKNSFEIINANGKVLSRVVLNFIPNDIIYISDDIVMATDADSTTIHKLSKEGQTLGVVDTAPFYPHHLCSSQDGGILVTLTETGSYSNKEKNRRFVRRYNKHFKKMADYEYNGKSRLFATPTKISENINGDICVTNKTSVNGGHVVVLDNHGKFRFRIEGSSSPQDPDSVKCDSVGHILVSDYYGKKIHVLKSNGELVQHVMVEDKAWPTAMGISDQGLLWRLKFEDSRKEAKVEACQIDNTLGISKVLMTTGYNLNTYNVCPLAQSGTLPLDADSSLFAAPISFDFNNVNVLAVSMDQFEILGWAIGILPMAINLTETVVLDNKDFINERKLNMSRKKISTSIIFDQKLLKSSDPKQQQLSHSNSENLQVKVSNFLVVMPDIKLTCTQTLYIIIVSSHDCFGAPGKN
ncbi:hypothetical protein KUTeg_021414 [Tegillarca granosa]|uniref:B box-type domain-containing protein n=1 Tax=Tegillarca granosa TaxID=220873 RepID=A0ABQ9E8Q6_TEGGR|nr:hypothetical protein KUTeg_021414 [Tegillarca granosa]